MSKPKYFLQTLHSYNKYLNFHRSSTEPCPHCHISGPGVSRIRDEVLTQCLKNRNDTFVGCQKLLDIEQKIQDTRRTLDILLKEKEALASTLNEHHDLLSRQLPVEIASQIFLQCLMLQPENFITNEYAMENAVLGSLFLPGQVSKNWRNIPRGTPKMWSMVCVTDRQSNDFSFVPFVQTWV